MHSLNAVARHSKTALCTFPRVQVCHDAVRHLNARHGGAHCSPRAERHTDRSVLFAEAARRRRDEMERAARESLKTSLDDIGTERRWLEGVPHRWALVVGIGSLIFMAACVIGLAIEVLR
jgi:hypothetical protein